MAVDNRGWDADHGRHRTFACQGKERYNTFDQARLAARRNRKDGTTLVAYHCRFCSGSHIGFPTPKPARRIKGRQRDRRRRQERDD